MPSLENLNGRPAIIVNDEPLPPYMATIRTNNRDHMVIDRDYYRELGKAGIRIFFLICDTVWLKPEALAQFREEAELLLDEVPDAYIIPRIGLHPTNQWIEAHPAETLTYSDGSRPPVHLFTESYETDLPAHYSLCSSEWRRDAGSALAETWDMLMALPYADRIIGCFLAAGGTSEWYYMLPMLRNGASLDHSDAFRREFSAYLTRVYGSDEALRRAWGKEDVTLAAPAIPDADGFFFMDTVDYEAFHPKGTMYSNSPVPPPPGNGTNIGSFIDFDRRRDVYDFFRAWHEGSAESVLHFARIIKERTPGALVGAFYGSYGCNHFLRSGSCGGTVKLLDSPLIDFLAAPGVYENRQPGGFVGQREMQDSFALRGKIYVVEDDTRTHMENRWFGDQYGMYDLTDSINVMKREFGRTLCEDVQAWWFDQLLGGRRYKCPELYQLIARQQQIAKEAYSLDRRKGCEIAFIYDEESGQAVSQTTTMELVELTRNYELARIGAPVDQYFHNDMANPAMPSYKLYVFFNTFVLTDAERAVIRAKLAKDGAVAVWMYAAGVINPDAEKKFAPAHIGELTGIEMGMLNDRYDGKFRFNGVEHPMFDGFDSRTVHGCMSQRKRNLSLGIAGSSATYLYPLFYSEDGDAAVPAYFLTSGKPAITVKETGGFTSVFYGSKTITAGLLRAIARYAGCHIWEDDGDVLYANRNYVTLHASSPGVKKLRFPRPCTPVEVYENRVWGEAVREIDVAMEMGETKMFRLK